MHPNIASVYYCVSSTFFFNGLNLSNIDSNFPSWPKCSTVMTFADIFEEIFHNINLVANLHSGMNIKFCHSIDFIQHYPIFFQLNTVDHGFAIVVRCLLI